MTRKRRSDWKVHFNPVTGSHVSWHDQVIWDEGECLQLTALDPFEFEGRLTYDRYEKGKTALNFIWKDDEDREFTMFISGLSKAMPYIVGGCLTGTFCFVKHGFNTGIEYKV